MKFHITINFITFSSELYLQRKSKSSIEIVQRIQKNLNKIKK